METKNASGGFEGVGAIGLKWFKKPKPGFINGYQVATAAHVN
jgi:hypothetical protein